MNSNRIFGLPDSPTADNDATSKKYVDNSIPIGGIIMWSGTTGTSLPSNWKLCDGSTYGSIKTPDLRGRFVLSSATQTSVGGIALAGGLTARTVDAIGGKETVALEVTHMPAHTHSVSAKTGDSNGIAQDGDHGHPVDVYSSPNGNPTKTYVPGGPQGQHIAYQFNGQGTIEWRASNNPTPYVPSANISNGTRHNHTITVTETSKGSDTAHENMPPFYVLAFIMRIS
jgi:microcystin-dependent protein